MGSQKKAGEAEKLEERRAFLHLCSIDLDVARHALRMLDRYTRKDVRYSILRDVVVTYARPFSDNKGKRITSHRLPEKIVPEKLRPLHSELISYRNQLFAHTDLNYYEPKFPVRSTSEVFGDVMISHRFDCSQLDGRVEEIQMLLGQVEQSIWEKVEIIKRRLH